MEAALASFWLLRKDRNDVLTLSLILIFVILIFLSFYFDANEYTPDTLLEEHILKVFTHAKKDLILSLSNAFLWCIVPFAVGLLVRKKFRQRFLWIFFAVLVVLKTNFEDYFLIHLYPERFTHFFEWGDVVVGWSLVYFVLALLVTKGRGFFNDNPEGSKL